MSTLVLDVNPELFADATKKSCLFSLGASLRTDTITTINHVQQAFSIGPNLTLAVDFDGLLLAPKGIYVLSDLDLTATITLPGPTTSVIPLTKAAASTAGSVTRARMCIEAPVSAVSFQNADTALTANVLLLVWS